MQAGIVRLNVFSVLLLLTTWPAPASINTDPRRPRYVNKLPQRRRRANKGRLCLKEPIAYRMGPPTPQQVEQAKTELVAAKAAVTAKTAVLAAAGVALEVQPTAACGDKRCSNEAARPVAGQHGEVVLYTVKEIFACIGFPHNKHRDVI